MRDQAEELRNLVLRATLDRDSQSGPAPQIVVLAGAKSGIGVTTVAIQLSVAMAQLGTRVVLVDGDSHSPRIAPWCGLSENGTLAEIAHGRRTIHEVLQRGPNGVQIVAGHPQRLRPGDTWNEKEFHRVKSQLRSLGKHVDTIVVDLGSHPDDVATFWKAAQHAVMVTTPDAAAVMESYASVKLHGGGESQPTISILVNQTDDLLAAKDVHRRIDQSCRRFLMHSVGFLGTVPKFASPPEGTSPIHLLLENDQGTTARAIERIAARLADPQFDAELRAAAA